MHLCIHKIQQINLTVCMCVYACACAAMKKKSPFLDEENPT